MLYFVRVPGRIERHTSTSVENNTTRDSLAFTLFTLARYLRPSRWAAWQNLPLSVAWAKSIHSFNFFHSFLDSMLETSFRRTDNLLRRVVFGFYLILLSQILPVAQAGFWYCHPSFTWKVGDLSSGFKPRCKYIAGRMKEYRTALKFSKILFNASASARFVNCLLAYLVYLVC